MTLVNLQAIARFACDAKVPWVKPGAAWLRSRRRPPYGHGELHCHKWMKKRTYFDPLLFSTGLASALNRRRQAESFFLKYSSFLLEDPEIVSTRSYPTAQNHAFSASSCGLWIERNIIEEAECRGTLNPGMTVVEATGGSTGSSLAFICSVEGYRYRIVSCRYGYGSITRSEVQPASSPAIIEGRTGSHRTSEREDRAMCRRLAREEGLLVGIPTGLNVVAAIALAKELGPGKTVVTVAVDTGLRYMNGNLLADA
ncbi:tryptophan synthase beta subunit-like PLP-dependent enzyme [Aspergillus welwitschiae]|uniref:Tryptophan synthase beta subunit-like PLP-dependent enzyme n=1 Tax=Aspergillus welwitschiae TaxID=1341132 RepID=A0A3F3PRK8_9EURO|nr:tryptophan synthase beta subunit-like PLP-dependent enzyme [Aspergillus welwitschiae]RDH28946.1 tryptophan synthase beta subunit-like PLP-dependent enzyme [Aspergillus welwitschiae]